MTQRDHDVGLADNKAGRQPPVSVDDSREVTSSPELLMVARKVTS